MINAVTIGILTAFFSFLFNFIVENLIGMIVFINNQYFSIYIFPILGGIILGLINKYIIKGNREFEIEAIEDELSHIDKYILNIKEVTIKLGASIISLVFGFSLGKQGSIIYLGGAVGSYISYKDKQTEEETITNILCGVSGMISGIFGMPILGVVFANEVIYKSLNLKRIFLTSISGITTLIILRVFGKGKLFTDLFILNTSENIKLWALIVFGIAAGLVAILYNCVIRNISSDILKKYPFIVSTLVGIILFIIGINMEEIFIYHSNSFLKLIIETHTIIYLMVYIGVKIIITGLSYNLGGFGGVFLPGLMIGGIFGKLAFLSLSQGSLEQMIILGISAVFGGFSGGPFAAVVLGFAISGYNYAIVLPLIIVSFISYYFVKWTRNSFLY